MKLNISQNIDLICVKVNSEQLNSIPIDWIKEDNSNYLLSCSENEKTYIPDENFEKVLISLGFDDIIDSYVLTSNIYEIKSLSMWGDDIKDMTGIEDFYSIEKLIIFQNNIEKIDLSQNILLEELEIYDFKWGDDLKIRSEKLINSNYDPLSF